MHPLTKSSISASLFVAVFALQAVAAGANIKSIVKRDDDLGEICGAGDFDDICLLLPDPVPECSSTCATSNLTGIKTCQDKSCICNSSVLSDYVACLQCATDNDKVASVGTDQDIYQGYLTSYGTTCNSEMETTTFTASTIKATATRDANDYSGTDAYGHPEVVVRAVGIGAVAIFFIVICISGLILAGVGYWNAVRVRNRRREMVQQYNKTQFED